MKKQITCDVVESKYDLRLFFAVAALGVLRVPFSFKPSQAPDAAMLALRVTQLDEGH